ncbi:MAG: tetratricopeptide repeat protein [Mycobacteriaceae bacterium]|nr:tetratricopeptide repeat protein [Mycobacteriaceae bacterium]
MTENEDQLIGGSGDTPQIVNITASDGGVAAYNIENLIINDLADLKAATTVLPLDAMVTDDPPFVGRQPELAQIAKALGIGDTATNIVVVSGPPGVGKTALVREAASAAHTAGRFHQVLFVDLRGYADDPDDRVQPEAVLSKLLLLLGVADDDIAADPAKQAIQYQQRLNELAAEGKSVLLWLDNASDLSQFDPLRPASPIHRVAVTTRETFGHIPKPQVVDVEVMSSDEAVDLLISVVEARNPGDGRLAAITESTKRLAELCDHLPLALQIVAALLADEPDRPIGDLVDELASEEDRLNSLEYDTDLSVRAAFALSYKRLPDGLKRLFRLMSVVPGGDVGLQTAGELIRVSHTAVRPQLMALVRSHLIQQHVTNRWSMHDLIRLYSAEQSATEPEDAERALKFVAQRYLVGAGAAAEWLTAVVSETAKKLLQSPEHAATWFEAERPTLIAIVMSLAKRPEYHELVLTYTIMLGEILQSQRHWLKEFRDVTTLGASLAADAQDRRNAACVLNLYGAALRKAGQFDDAIKAYERAIQISEEIGDIGVASAARSNIANVYNEQGRFEEALPIYWEDVRVCRESDPPHRYHEAVTLTNIGAALARAERYHEALPPLRDAIKIRRELKDLPGIASSAKNLGGVLSRVGREANDPGYLEEAIDLLQEAADIYRKRGNISGCAEVANNLGQTQCQLRRFADGIPNLRAALEYFEKTDQTCLAAEVRADIESYLQEAPSQGPWAAASLGNNRYRFTNTSGGRLAMIVLTPAGATQAKVIDGVDSDPHVVPAPIQAGDSFDATVRGPGVRIMATAVPSEPSDRTTVISAVQMASRMTPDREITST